MLHKLKRIDMEAKDLRIGNYVGAILNEDSQNFFTVIETGETMKCYEGLSTVDVIYCERYNTGFWNIDYFEPIPLTEEWLLKFGFEEDSCNYYKIIENQEAVLYIDKLDMTFAYGYPYECSGGDLKLKHVHQLQNLYFALTNKELTIKP